MTTKDTNGNPLVPGDEVRYASNMERYELETYGGVGTILFVEKINSEQAVTVRPYKDPNGDLLADAPFSETSSALQRVGFPS